MKALIIRRMPRPTQELTFFFSSDVSKLSCLKIFFRSSLLWPLFPLSSTKMFMHLQTESSAPRVLTQTNAWQKRNVTRPTQEPAKVVSNEPNDEPAKVVPKKDKEPEKMPDTEPLNKPIEEPAKKPNSEPANKFPTMTCPICLHPLVKASSTICGHVFCTGCIKEAIRAFKKCPTCRTKLTIKNVHPIFLPRWLSGWGWFAVRRGCLFPKTAPYQICSN